jgi:hypothetical protein
VCDVVVQQQRGVGHEGGAAARRAEAAARGEAGPGNEDRSRRRTIAHAGRA